MFLKAPIPFVVMSLIGFGIGYVYFHEQLDDSEKEIRRLNEQLGIEKPESVRPLLRLTNTELKKKGTNAIQKIRAVVSYHEDQNIELNSKMRKREITDIQFQESREREQKRATEELTDKVTVDAFMVFDELYKRVPGAARMQFGLPRINPADKRDESPTSYRLFLGINSAQRFANDIEELVKALPD